MRYSQLRAMSEEFEKISNETGPLVSFLVEGYQNGMPKLTQTPNMAAGPDSQFAALGLLNRAATLMSGAIRAKAKETKDKAYAANPPSIQTALKDLGDYRTLHNIDAMAAAEDLKNSKLNDVRAATMLTMVGMGDSAKEQVSKLVKAQAPKTVATIGALVGGSLLINHLVKKYRNDQTTQKKGTR